MSNELIRQANEKHLAALPGNTLDIAWENKNYKPTEAAFMAPFTLFAEPDDFGYKDSPFIQRGIFTITLLFPTNQGPDDVQTKAEELRNHYKRGTSLPNGPIVVVFDRTPEITGGNIEDNRFVMRVRCRFYAQINQA